MIISFTLKANWRDRAINAVRYRLAALEGRLKEKEDS